MDDDQICRIFHTANHDVRIDHTIEHYAIRKWHIRPRPEIRAPVMWAIEDFLKRGNKAQAATYRDQAETLEKAVALLADDKVNGFQSFAALMAHNRQGGTGSSQAKHALSAMQAMAQGWRALADTHEIAAVNNTFFYCLGSRFKREGDLPLPSATEAHSIFTVIVDAISNESPALLNGTKTDYDPTGERGSEVRRLMRSGYNSGGGEKPLLKTP